MSSIIPSSVLLLKICNRKFLVKILLSNICPINPLICLGVFLILCAVKVFLGCNSSVLVDSFTELFCLKWLEKKLETNAFEFSGKPEGSSV